MKLGKETQTLMDGDRRNRTSDLSVLAVNLCGLGQVTSLSRSFGVHKVRMFIAAPLTAQQISGAC